MIQSREEGGSLPGYAHRRLFLDIGQTWTALCVQADLSLEEIERFRERGKGTSAFSLVEASLVKPAL